MASLTTHSGVLGLRKAKHLLRRASFTYTKTNITSFAALTVTDALAILNTSNANDWSEPNDPYPLGNPDGNWTSSQAHPNSFSGQGRKRRIVTAWWWHNARQQTTLKHKLAFFLHTSFTIAKGPVSGSSTQFYDHLKLLDFYAFGNLKTLAKKITLDNSMLSYLDNRSNNANNPNENYAREFLELFTILKGPQIANDNYTNYTEIDVQQAAKVFSGIKTKDDRSIIDPDTNLPIGRIDLRNHDKNDKTFSDAFNQQTIVGKDTATGVIEELSDFVDMVFNQDATAISYCRKLYRYFVKSEWNADVETNIILPLATELKANGYEMAPIVTKLLSSEHFFDTDNTVQTDQIIGSIVKSPVQLINEILSHFNVTIPKPDNDIENFLAFFNFVDYSYLLSAGMGFYEPDSVAGYPAHYQEPDYDRHWFSSNTALGRYKLIESLIAGKNTLGNNRPIEVTLNMVSYVKDNITAPADASALVTELTDLLFPESIDETRKNYYIDFLLDGFPSYYWSDAWSAYLGNGDDTVVKTRLNALVTAIINSPEFQLM